MGIDCLLIHFCFLNIFLTVLAFLISQLVFVIFLLPTLIILCVKLIFNSVTDFTIFKTDSKILQKGFGGKWKK